MSCAWRGTIISGVVPSPWIAATSDTYPESECWSPADAPARAGSPRGLFRFITKGWPGRTHGGLPTQAGIEDRIGREIPDPPEPYLDVYYWHPQPRVFEVENLSGETVTVEANAKACLGDWQDTVSDGVTKVYGPFFPYAFPGCTAVQVFGATTLPGGFRTVPSGVSVRVTEANLEDPGVSFDFSCRAPAVA